MIGEREMGFTEITDAIKDLTDEDLTELRAVAAQEQERRESVNAIPDQITALRDQYLEAGGDPAALED